MVVRVQPKELEIPEDDPFKNDLLGRKDPAEALTSIVGAMEGPCVLAVDAGWGMGKTTFQKMWTRHLRKQNFPVVEFNAWETDFANSPFVALSSELTGQLYAYSDLIHDKLSQLKATSAKVLRATPGAFLRVAVSAVPYVGPQASKELEAALDSLADKAVSQYQGGKEAVARFKELLQMIAGNLACSREGKPLVVVIDELDRCRPSYAIELLEAAKHLFTVDHIVFVLTLDRSQLAHSIKVLYGSEFDASGYLRRFFDTDFQLPEPDRTAFIKASLSSLGVGEHLQLADSFNKADAGRAGHLLTTALSASPLSLRDIAQTIHRLCLVLSSIVNPEPALVRLVVVLLLMRTFSPELYRRFIENKASDEEAVQALFSGWLGSAIRSTGGSDEIEALVIAAQYEAVHLEGAFDQLSARVPRYWEYSRLADTHPSEEQREEHQRAQRILRFVKDFFEWKSKPLGFKHAVNRLEMLAPDQGDAGEISIDKEWFEGI